MLARYTNVVKQAQTVQNKLADIKDITYLGAGEINMIHLSNMIIFCAISRA